MGGISTEFGSSILTWITFLPIIGMIVLLLIPAGKDDGRSFQVSLFNEHADKGTLP